MYKYIGLMLFFILAAIITSYQDTTSFNEKKQADIAAMLVHNPGKAVCFDKAQYFHYSDAEQNEIFQNYQRINSLRYKRLLTAEKSLFFKPFMQNVSVSSLSVNYSYKAYSSSNGFLSQSVSGYYVFTLRHIII